MGVYKRGNTWYIDYYDQYGRRHREAVGRNKRQAEQALAKRKTEVAEGKFLDKKKVKKTRLSDLANQFIEYYSKPNKRSWQRDRQLLNNIIQHFGNKYIHEITSFDLEKYKKKRTNKVTPSTVNRELACLKTMFYKAIEWGKAGKNPVTKVKFYKESNYRVRYLESEEIERLLENCADHLRPIITMAVNTGMRLSEILNLKWKDIDFGRELIYIVDSKNKEQREIPLNDLLTKLLKEQKENTNSEYVFSHKDGSPFKSIRTGFIAACRRAGIKDFRFHDLRHTFASHLVMSGVDLRTVQELCGHKSFNMTLRYAHLSPDHKRKTMDTVGSKMQKVVTNWSQEQKSEKEENF